MALITKMLEVAVNDCDNGRITAAQLMSVCQEAIDNGDILEEQNELHVVLVILPAIDRGILRTSEHVTKFEARMAAKVSATVQASREQKGSRPWWRFWQS